jgi:DNA-binding transcriptional MerR regulator
MTLIELLRVLEEDRDVVETLITEGMLISPIDRYYTDEEVEQARVARVLLRELEVNAAGVQVILHMRQQIVALRRQMIDVLTEMQMANGRDGSDG